MQLSDLYRDVILDHNRRPRNFGDLSGADATVEGFNPLCGDRLTLRLKLAGDRIDAALSQDIKSAVASLEKIQVKDLMNLLVRINAS